MSESEICPKFAAAFEVLGKRWTGLIITVLLSGQHHFNEILAAIPQLTDRTLSTRLKELVDEDIVTRSVYSEIPVRIEYHLTDKGFALQKFIDGVQEWADAWAGESGLAEQWSLPALNTDSNCTVSLDAKSETEAQEEAQAPLVLH